MKFFEAIDPNNRECMKTGDTFEPDGHTAEITLKDNGLFYYCNEQEPIWLSVDILDFPGKILRAKPKEPVALSAEEWLREQYPDKYIGEFIETGGYHVSCMRVAFNCGEAQGIGVGRRERDNELKPFLDGYKRMLWSSGRSVNEDELKEIFENLKPLED